MAKTISSSTSRHLNINLTLIVGAARLLATLVFSVQNAGAVDVRFLAWKFSTSLAWVVFGALAAGLIGGWAMTSALRRTSTIPVTTENPL